MSGGKIKKQVFREGEVIFEEGGPGDYACMVMQGEIGIYKNLRSEAPLHLAILYKGDIFVEMALFDASVPTASAKSDTESICLAVSKQEFDRRLDNTDPIIKSMMQCMMGRVRSISDEAERLRKKQGRSAIWNSCVISRH